MKQVLELMNNHRSIRKYSEEPVTEAQLAAILDAVQAAPSSINGQQTTVVVIRDAERKRTAAQLVGGQAWVEQAPVFLIFCADFHRAALAVEKAGEEMVITDSVESVLVGATDVGIALGFATVAAEAQGLGIVPIGGVRRNPKEMIELLELPKLVFPVCGLVVGHPADSAAFSIPPKPRLPQTAIRHEERYRPQVGGLIEEYDRTVAAYNSQLSAGAVTANWSETIARYYKTKYYPHVRAMLDQQGFGLD